MTDSSHNTTRTAEHNRHLSLRGVLYAAWIILMQLILMKQNRIYITVLTLFFNILNVYICLFMNAIILLIYPLILCITSCNNLAVHDYIINATACMSNIAAFIAFRHYIDLDKQIVSILCVQITYYKATTCICTCCLAAVCLAAIWLLVYHS